MGIEKDTTFKFVGKNFFNVFSNIVKVPKSVDASKIDEITEDLISLKIAQFIPDFVGSDGKIILMLEYESSFVGIKSKKRFHVYVALFDYEHNPDNKDIVFCVITTKEKSKIVEYKIGDTDSFKISIFNIADLGMEKIISNSTDKIEKQEIFSVEDLVYLALTSLMPGNRKEIIEQFHILSEMMDDILFENNDARTSFCGIILLLSNLYFEKNDPVRKKIQGVFMGKVDCIVEMREESFDEGFDEGCGKTLRGIVKNLLKDGFSINDIVRLTDLSEDEVEKLKSSLGF